MNLKYICIFIAFVLITKFGYSWSLPCSIFVEYPEGGPPYKLWITLPETSATLMEVELLSTQPLWQKQLIDLNQVHFSMDVYEGRFLLKFNGWNDRVKRILLNGHTLCEQYFERNELSTLRLYSFKYPLSPKNSERGSHSYPEIDTTTLYPIPDKITSDSESLPNNKHQFENLITPSEARFINPHILNNYYCGRIDPTVRGIPLAQRGTIVGRGSWPWLVAIFKGSDFNINFLCGGTLVTSKAVISSAHCFTSSSGTITSQEIKIFLGRSDFRNWSERGSLSSNCEQIHVHPDYRPDTSFDADIAILVLDLEVTFSRYIRPACVVSGIYGVEDIVDQEGVVSGWGKDETQQNSQIAKSVRGKVVTEDTCFANDDAFRYLTSRRNFCAGNLDGTGPCAGDSGGGFLVPHNNQWTLRGTTSASLSTLTNECDLNKYIVYVDVSKFYTWIKEIIDNTS